MLLPEALAELPPTLTTDTQDKRAHHNALERKRRDHIKDSFTSLRDSIPSLNGEKMQVCDRRPVSAGPSDRPSQASRAQILKKAAEYIQTMRRKNTSHQQDIEDLRKQNKVLEEQSECRLRVTMPLTESGQ